MPSSTGCWPPGRRRPTDCQYHNGPGAGQDRIPAARLSRSPPGRQARGPGGRRESAACGQSDIKSRYCPGLCGDNGMMRYAAVPAVAVRLKEYARGLRVVGARHTDIPHACPGSDHDGWDASRPAKPRCTQRFAAGAAWHLGRAYSVRWPVLQLCDTPDRAWTATSGRMWLDVLPGVVTLAGGLIVLLSRFRPAVVFGPGLLHSRAPGSPSAT